MLQKEVHPLTPLLSVSNADPLDEETRISTKLDMTTVSNSPDLLCGMLSVVCLYWVFEVEFPKSLKKTLNFMCGHVCGLQKVENTVAFQRVLNML